jgi:hypothetical protein
MARGFASKSVADQQEQAAAPAPKKPSTEDSAAILTRRRRLELSRADVQRRLEGAQVKLHREMLQRALDALDEEIASLG